jgi:flagellar basal body-associated protein FliL
LYYEELCTKTRSLKSIIVSYFSGQTKAQLQKKGESTVKAQLRNLLNKELVLGKIDALYFGEYLFFE